jgi:hypothetical protein
MSKQPSVAFLNPRTCGIYKDGGTRYKTDPKTGLRTTEIDNELLEYVTAHLKSESPPGTARVTLSDIFSQQVLVPTYYDHRYDDGIRQLLKDNKLDGVTIGELIDSKQIGVRGGHGSPSNDQRACAHSGDQPAHTMQQRQSSDRGDKRRHADKRAFRHRS